MDGELEAVLAGAGVQVQGACCMCMRRYKVQPYLESMLPSSMTGTEELVDSSPSEKTLEYIG